MRYATSGITGWCFCPSGSQVGMAPGPVLSIWRADQNSVFLPVLQASAPFFAPGLQRLRCWTLNLMESSALWTTCQKQGQNQSWSLGGMPICFSASLVCCGQRILPCAPVVHFIKTWIYSTIWLLIQVTAPMVYFDVNLPVLLIRNPNIVPEFYSNV